MTFPEHFRANGYQTLAAGKVNHGLGDPLLFDYHREFGISEQNDVAHERSDVVSAIRAYLSQNVVSARRVTMPRSESVED